MVLDEAYVLVEALWPRLGGFWLEMHRCEAGKNRPLNTRDVCAIA